MAGVPLTLTQPQLSEIHRELQEYRSCVSVLTNEGRYVRFISPCWKLYGSQAAGEWDQVISSRAQVDQAGQADQATG